MTTSTHTYAAWLIGTPDRKLGLRGGTVTIDNKRAPHVEASIAVSVPDVTLLGLLDPRGRKRVRLEATATTTFGSQTRTFNLAVRGRPVKHSAAYMTLSLTSDEALLDDYAPLATDTGAYALQDSIRAVVNYVLGLALPGASLAPGGDAPIRALISSTNLLGNSRAKNDLAGWLPAGGVALTRYTSGGPSGAATYVTAQRSGSAGQILVAYAEDNVSLQAGRRYRISMWQNADAGTQTAIDAVLFDSAGNTLADLPETPQSAPAGWFRRSIEFTAPAGVKQVWVRSFTTGSVAAGRSLNTTGLRLSEITDDPTDTVYFDSDTPSTSEYAYTASGNGHARTALIDRASDLLTWRVGVSALAFLAPILQALGLRLVCDEARVWTLRDPDYDAGGSVSIRYGVNLIDADDVIDLTETDFCDAAVVVWRWRDLTGMQQERVDAYQLVPIPTRVRRVERDSPYPGPGLARHIVRSAQGSGRQVTATAVADWRTKADQSSEFTLPGAPTQLGSTSRVVFNLDRDEMTITSRTVDVPASAWLLIPTGERWIDSPVGASWIGEVV